MRRRAKILVVDDDADFRHILSAHLADSGYDAVFLETLENVTNLARLERPDAILLDMRVPGGDSFEVTRELRAEPGVEKTPIILMSAYHVSFFKDRAAQAGVTRLLQKPFTRDDLVAALESELSARNGDDVTRPDEEAIRGESRSLFGGQLESRLSRREEPSGEDRDDDRRT